MRSYALLLLLGVQVGAETPLETFGTFCPCASRFVCNQDFGADSALTDILQVVPACGIFQVRCCSDEAFFAAIVAVVKQDAVVRASTSTVSLSGPSEVSSTTSFSGLSAPATSTSAPPAPATSTSTPPATPVTPTQLFFARSLELPELEVGAADGRQGRGKGAPSRLECVPTAQCQDVYGSRVEHFNTFGFVSPSENRCAAGSGTILCVVPDHSPPAQEMPPTITRPPPIVIVRPPPGHTPILSNPTLQCLSRNRCSVQNVYGFRDHHFTSYGFLRPKDFKCPTGQVLCIVPSRTTPSPSPPPTTPSPQPTPSPPPPLQCVPESSCPLERVYGSRREHFLIYGFISPSAYNCPANEGKLLCIPPGFPLAIQQPAGPTVNIYGPQPVYISQDQVKGGHAAAAGQPGGRTGAVVPGGGTFQGDSQINNILSSLKDRLQVLLSGPTN